MAVLSKSETDLGLVEVGLQQLQLWNELPFPDGADKLAPEVDNANDIKLLDLPEELIEEILKKFGTSPEIFNLRSVTPVFKKLVDESIGIHVNFEQTTTMRKVFACKRITLRTAIFRNSAYLPIINSSIFLKPARLLSVTFEGWIRTSFFIYILQNCCNLENFHSYGTITERISKFRPKRTDLDKIELKKIGKMNSIGPFRLHKLRSLDLRMVKPEDGMKEAFEAAENTVFVLNNIMGAPLVTLCIETWELIGCLNHFEINTIIVRFLKRNNLSGLQKMFICYRYKFLTPYEIQMFAQNYKASNDMGGRGGRMSLWEMHRCMINLGQVIQLSSFLVTLCSKDDPWLSFINEQKRLTKLGICDDVGLSNWSSLSIPLVKNFGTLTTVYIMFNVERDVINFASFHGCTGLRELLLVNLKESYVNMMNEQFINVDIQNQCPNLIFFATTNLTWNRNNLQQILVMKDLKYLALLNSGMGLNVGVDFQLFMAFMQKRSLEGLALDGIVADSFDQLAFINELVKMVNRPEDELIFGDNVLNVRDEGHPWNRRWWRGGTGFVFDIDFYAD